MKRIGLALTFAVMASVGLLAVENSNIYMPLVQSLQFLNRVQYILAQEAPVIMAESGAITCHTKRAALAVSVAQNPAGYAAIFGVHLATNINVTSAGALTGTSTAGTLDSPITDAAMLAAVASIWPTVAGCVTNPQTP